jgi:diguanylate cyclase (GGDEF)-like protein
VQTLLDMLIISLCIMALLWLFVFEKDLGKAEIIGSDLIPMLSVLIDSLIFGGTGVWFFSTRIKKSPLYISVMAVGGVIFVISDLWYYYVYFYFSYQPNSWPDVGYMLGFTVMAVSGFLKAQNKTITKNRKKFCTGFFSFSKEAVLIIMPFLIIFFKRSEKLYFLLLIVAILIYYVLSNYTQKAIFQEKLLGVEKQHVAELEAKVEERTKEIVKIMNTYVVTGLYNRRYFEEYLSKFCDTLPQQERVYLLYIELNNYKGIKALYGRYVAETLLKETGKRLNEMVSEIGEKTTLAHYEESVFIIALGNNQSMQQSTVISQNILYKCCGRYDIENHDIGIAMNIGIACYPSDSDSYEDLIKHAEYAMMYSRKKGMNVITQYNKSIGNIINKRNMIEMKLEKIDYDEELRLHFQPQVMCKTGNIIGTEALLRWYNKDGTVIQPNEFIPIMEETGQIVPVGYWVMENAARQLSLWGNGFSGCFRMAINVSVKQLGDLEFVPHLKTILKKYHIRPECFEIEITENIQMDGTNEILDNLNAIRGMGISVAIDDFGTGYSSLYYLKNLPMDRIKIAKELVDDIEKDAYGRAMVRMVIEMAQNNGVKVIAEGVETKEQWEYLKTFQCNEIQGYYFGKPVLPEEILHGWMVKSFIHEKQN